VLEGAGYSNVTDKIYPVCEGRSAASAPDFGKAAPRVEWNRRREQGCVRRQPHRRKVELSPIFGTSVAVLEGCAITHINGSEF